MKKYYMAGMHHVTKALEAADVNFPISKADLLAKVGDKKIKVDFDKEITIKEFAKNIKIESFYNKAQFFNALVASSFNF